MGKVLIVGCGGVASVAVHKCCQNSKVFDAICIASRTVSKCEALKEKLQASYNGTITTAQVDADNPEELIALIEREKPGVVLNLALPYQDLTIMDACLATGVDYVDTANYEPEDTAKFEYKWQWAYREKFEKAGITEVPDSLEGIGEIGQQLLDNGGAGEAMSMGIYGWFFEQLISKQGLEYANNGNGRKEAATAVAFDENGAAKNILTVWKDLNDKGFAPIVGKGGDAGLADFSAGKSAITLGSTASLKQILQDVNGKFEVGTAYFPKVSSSDEGGVSIGGASLWALDNQDPKKLRATWEFIKFLISPESQAYWNAQTGYFPVTVAAQEEETFKQNVAEYPQFQTAIDQLHDSAPEYAGALLSVFPEARAIVESEIESLLNGNEDVDAAVKNMTESINGAIEEYNLVNE